MLSLLVSNATAPVNEPLDRDPGVITLAAMLVRALHRQHEAAFRRRCDLAGRTGPLV